MTAAGIGHNLPPTTLEMVQADLAEKHGALVARKDDLVASAGRAPATVEDDETAGRVADLIRLISTCSKTADAARVGAKEPYLEGGRVVDGWFKNVTTPLAETKAKLERPLNTYLVSKAAQEKARREAEAKALEEAAAREAAAMTTPAQLDAAVAIETKAAEVRESVTEKPADMARTRGDYGSVATLRTAWTFEVLAPQLVPRHYLMVNEAAIKAAVKAGARDGEIPGVRIYQGQRAIVR